MQIFAHARKSINNKTRSTLINNISGSLFRLKPKWGWVSLVSPFKSKVKRHLAIIQPGLSNLKFGAFVNMGLVTNYCVLWNRPCAIVSISENIFKPHNCMHIVNISKQALWSLVIFINILEEALWTF